jgi:DNA-binding NarL/FixJ family response regulator
MITVAIIHSQPVYRKGLSLLLKNGIEGLKVIASAGSLRDLLEQFRGAVIDVIIWDIPGHHALTPGARVLRECYPLSKLLVLVSSSNSVYAGLLETLGANAVLPADCQETELYKTILKIHESYAPPPSSNHVQEPLAKDISPRLESKESKNQENEP